MWSWQAASRFALPTWGRHSAAVMPAQHRTRLLRLEAEASRVHPADQRLASPGPAAAACAASAELSRSFDRHGAASAAWRPCCSGFSQWVHQNSSPCSNLILNDSTERRSPGHPKGIDSSDRRLFDLHIINSRTMATSVALMLTVACQIAMAHVIELEPTNFGLTSNGSSWMLEFYAPWSVPVALPYFAPRHTITTPSSTGVGIARHLHRSITRRPQPFRGASYLAKSMVSDL